MSAGENQLTCDLCMKQLSSRYILQSHMRIHTGEKPYKSEICNRSFAQKTSLNAHIRVHTGEKPHKCEECSESFAQKSSLNDHMRVHTGQKPYKCEICSKSFTHRTGITSHMRLHTGEKPYKCEVCSKSFAQKYSLSTHVRIHTGEKPYKCSVCSKSFAQKSALNAHHKIIHTKSSIPASISNGHKGTHVGDNGPISCDLCVKPFTRRRNFQRHMRVHHGETPFKCEKCNRTFASKSSLSNHIIAYAGKKYCDRNGRQRIYLIETAEQTNKPEIVEPLDLLNDTKINVGFKKSTSAEKEFTVEARKNKLELTSLTPGHMPLKSDKDVHTGLIWNEQTTINSSVIEKSDLSAEISQFVSSPLTEYANREVQEICRVNHVGPLKQICKIEEKQPGFVVEGHKQDLPMDEDNKFELISELKTTKLDHESNQYTNNELQKWRVIGSELVADVKIEKF